MRAKWIRALTLASGMVFSGQVHGHVGAVFFDDAYWTDYKEKDGWRWGNEDSMKLVIDGDHSGGRQLFDGPGLLHLKPTVWRNLDMSTDSDLLWLRDSCNVPLGAGLFLYSTVSFSWISAYLCT